jgi:mono/diheme cytochrome c family protein
VKRFAFVLSLLGIVAAAAYGASPAPPTATVSIQLPGDAGMAFKPGPGLAVVQANCLVCHSSAYVSTQPVFSRAQWTAEVTKMKAVYGAQIADDAFGPIVDYLVSEYGKP